ncbi:type II toxin-antitoxin system HicB family antitoxin [Billgrantia endophytica]|uniref:type II toxin-antitoxin system HicB family antitoxin n=1 Tax=Billgrantia endophytica TaxID=2033802 RepID=UPI001056C3B5
MLYPVYIHKDPDSACGVTFPDFPGCFSAADELSDLPRMAQEAVEVYFEGENIPIPAPSVLDSQFGRIYCFSQIGRGYASHRQAHIERVLGASDHRVHPVHPADCLGALRWHAHSV